MTFSNELLRLKSYVEAHLYLYLLDRFPFLKDESNFKLYKRISVSAPFGKIVTRDQNGRSQIQPEICVTIGQELGLVAEAAAWDDDSYGNHQSEAHKSMHQIGMDKNCVYFAQKVICQILPAFQFCTQKTTECYAFLSFTENHKDKMEKVLNHLITKNIISSFSRPLESNDDDVKKYYQLIYEIKFPDSLESVIDQINYYANNNTEQNAPADPGG